MLPRALPHASVADEKPMYRLNIDMPGFRPEDIKSIDLFDYLKPLF